MLKLIKNVKTETYDAGHGYRVDITEDGEIYEMWIYHKDYSVKDHCFGLPSDTTQKDKFMEAAEAMLPDAIEDYKYEHDVDD